MPTRLWLYPSPSFLLLFLYLMKSYDRNSTAPHHHTQFLTSFTHISSLPVTVISVGINNQVFMDVPPVRPSTVCHVSTELALSQTQPAIMKTDWSQQCPHFWQTSRATPCYLFQTAPFFNSKKSWRLLNQRLLGYSDELCWNLDSSGKNLRIKNLSTSHLKTWCWLPLCLRPPLSEGAMPWAYVARWQREKGGGGEACQWEAVKQTWVGEQTGY